MGGVFISIAAFAPEQSRIIRRASNSVWPDELTWICYEGEELACAHAIVVAAPPWSCGSGTTKTRLLRASNLA